MTDIDYGQSYTVTEQQLFTKWEAEDAMEQAREAMLEAREDMQDAWKAQSRTTVDEGFTMAQAQAAIDQATIAQENYFAAYAIYEAARTKYLALAGEQSEDETERAEYRAIRALAVQGW